MVHQAQTGRVPEHKRCGPPTSGSLVSCDPFQPITKPVTLTTVLRRRAATRTGTLYVVDQSAARR